MLIVTRKCQSCSIGSHFYSVNIATLYWEYETIASVYKGFNLREIREFSVRQRDYWYRFAIWKSK